MSDDTRFEEVVVKMTTHPVVVDNHLADLVEDNLLVAVGILVVLFGSDDRPRMKCISPAGGCMVCVDYGTREREGGRLLLQKN